MFYGVEILHVFHITRRGGFQTRPDTKPAQSITVPHIMNR